MRVHANPPPRAARRRLVAAGAAFALVAGLALATPASSSAAAPHAVGDPASLVNPLVGTSGAVDTFPGVDAPFGMLQWSPDTSPDRPAGGGYEYDDSLISGFSLDHISGPGCGAGGDIPMLPYVGDTGSKPGDLTVPFSHSNETAKIGYYSVKTGAGADAVTTALTGTTRAGLGKFTFPAGTQSNLVLKLAGSATTVDGTSASVIGNKEVIGSVTTGHFCGQSADEENDYTLHFDVRFNQPFTAKSVGTSSNGGPANEVLTFDTTKTQSVTSKVGISYTSDTNAIANLADEIPAWDFSGTRAQTTKAWDDLLGKIEIGGGSRTQQAQFYTAMYHALLHPNVFSDDNGQYMGMDNKVHTAADGHEQYANYSGWDIYRSQVQLAAMVAPQQTSDSITSMLNDYDQSGMLPKWAFNNGESYVMVGDPADSIIADAYAFGARDFDTSHALSAMIDEATQTNNIRPAQSARDQYGYIPNDKQYGCCNFYGSVSTLLEYDSADYAIASLAKTLGRHSTYSEFASRAQDWQNVFNPASGYVQAKQADGNWVPGFTPSTSTGMVEGTAAQYTPMVPFNIKALAAARGGNAKYGSYLDSLFTSIDHPSSTNADLSNEPSIEIPWEYDYVGMPWKTQQTVREAQQKLYFNAPVGQFGNDDLGAMSSWYVWSNLGMYPETPGTATLAMGSPTFPLTEVHLANGKTLTITAPNAAPNAPYVHGLSINGKASSKPWTTWSTLDKGPTMNVDLGTTADTSWGTAAADAPPSDGTGESPVFTSVAPSSLIEQPGASSTTQVTVTNISKTARTVKWTAKPSSGVTVSPDHGTLQVPAGQTVSAPLTVTAGSSSEGRYTVAVSFTMGADQLSSSSVSVAVAKAGEVWPYYTNAGITDDDNTDAATFDGEGWSYSAAALAAQGVKPGGTVSADGVQYVWPDVPSASLDNIEMSGQTIPLAVPAGATKIGLLGSASNADATTGAGGTVTVTYTDGSTSTFTAMFSDWTLGAGENKPVAGNVTAAKTAYRNAPGNTSDGVDTYLFGIDAPLTAGKTVASITLPTSMGGDAHVFAIGFDGTTSASSQARTVSPKVATAPTGRHQRGHVVPASRRP
ncbi:GH92 family glycosyl hydrolase [uncultured Jatrophihabitans sp.]|uniref:GH92 family glycosyl hydrolase n=1 Tax=uncultured Jatrophihabitans sp. TaxID=1610747 RepID=UPI0035CB5564